MFWVGIKIAPINGFPQGGVGQTQGIGLEHNAHIQELDNV